MLVKQYWLAVKRRTIELPARLLGDGDGDGDHSQAPA